MLFTHLQAVDVVGGVMPGAYAHITLASLLLNKQEMRSRDDFDRRAEVAVRSYGEFMILGCMSPDFPYLAVTQFGSSKWADLMHENSGSMLRKGVDIVKAYDGADRQKGLAWLLGYASHVCGDLTIHPVLSENGFDYAVDPKAHRVCEMHQDTFIFPNLNLGGVGLAEYMPNVVGACRDLDDDDEIDPVIEQIWRQMLQACYPDQYADDEPNIDAWFRQFKDIVNLIARAGTKMFDWGRQIAASQGILYPSQDQVDKGKYITSLKTPGGGTIHYNDLFEKARQNAYGVWDIVSQGLYDIKPGIHHTEIKDWNLDTGLDGPAGSSVYW